MGADVGGDLRDLPQAGPSSGHDDEAEVGGADDRLALDAVDARRLEHDQVTGLEQRCEHGAEPVGGEQLTALVAEPPGQQAEQGLDAGLQHLQDAEPFVEQRLGQAPFLDLQATAGPVGPSVRTSTTR